MMKDLNKKHPYLDTLKTMWNLPDETLNEILWENTNDDTRYESIGLTNEYLNYMDSIEQTTNPAEAWESWCINNDVEHEISTNPYIK